MGDELERLKQSAIAFAAFFAAMTGLYKAFAYFQRTVQAELKAELKKAIAERDRLRRENTRLKISLAGLGHRYDDAPAEAAEESAGEITR